MICGDVKMRSNERMWRWEDDMCRCEDERIWRWDDNMWRCEHLKIWRCENVSPTPKLEEPFTQTLSGKQVQHFTPTSCTAFRQWQACWACRQRQPFGMSTEAIFFRHVDLNIFWHVDGGNLFWHVDGNNLVACRRRQSFFGMWTGTNFWDVDGNNQVLACRRE